MERKPYPSENQERFIVRLPDGMRDLIADEAKKNNRSMNAEIVARLQQSFQPNIRWAQGGDVTRLITGEAAASDSEFELLVRAMQEALRRQRETER